MGYIIGLDQGGSKTIAAVADCRGNILGSGNSNGACHASTGMKYAMGRVDEAFKRALKAASIRPEEVDMIAAGMTGADWPYEYALLKSALIETTGVKKVKVVNDCIIAMRGGTCKTYGAVICAGTGLNIAVKSADGREHIFGYYINRNTQGGEALGTKAIEAVFDAEAGIVPSTALTELILDYFSISNVDKLLFKFVNGKLPAKTKDLVPLLFQAADIEDAVALDIIKEFGCNIARYTVAGLRRFDMLQTDIDIVISGGIFKARNPVLKETLNYEIHKDAEKARIINALYEPVAGAVLIALDDLYGSSLPDDITGNVLSSSRRLNLIRTWDK